LNSEAVLRNGNLSKNSTCGKLLPWQRSQTRANVTLLNIFYGVGIRELIVALASLKISPMKNQVKIFVFKNPFLYLINKTSMNHRL